MTSRLLFPLLALLCLAGQTVTAEEIRVRTLALGSEKMPEVHVQQKKEKGPVLLTWPTRQPSPGVVALRDGTLPLYRREQDAEGKDVFPVAEQVKIPPGAKEILLLGTVIGEETKYLAIEDDFVGARFNKWLLINLSSKPIAFRVGRESKAIKLAAGASEIYRIGVAQGRGAEVLAQAPIKGEVKTFYSTYWPVRDGQRTVILFSDQGKKIAVRRICDKLAQPNPVQ